MGNKKTELAATSAEVIVNLETENKGETIMENQKVEVKKEAIISLAKEMNTILVGCKIDFGKNITKDVIVGQILSHELELVSSDFVPADETSVVFSHEAMETLIAIGVTIPEPPKEKAAKKADKGKKEKGVTKQSALIEALKTTVGTREEIVTEANRILRLAVPGEESKGVYVGGRARCDKDIMTKLFRETAPILLAFGSISFNEETKKYSLSAVSDEKA